MTWFTASILTCIEFDEKQGFYPVYEDFYLIEAIDQKEARNKAETIGKEIEEANDALSFDGKPAKQKYIGIRKIRSIYNPPPIDIDQERPRDGSELSHSYYIVRDKEVLSDLAKGTAVEILYVDDEEDTKYSLDAWISS